MATDTKQKVENWRNTFKARAKSKLKKWYIEGHRAQALDTIADPFREEAEILFSGEELVEHREYVELLVDAGEKAVEDTDIHPYDPETLVAQVFDNIPEDRERDGERFEQAIDDVRDRRGENA